MICNKYVGVFLQGYNNALILLPLCKYSESLIFCKGPSHRDLVDEIRSHRYPLRDPELDILEYIAASTALLTFSHRDTIIRD